MNEWIDAKRHKPSVVDASTKHSGHVLTFGPKGIGVGYYHAGMGSWIRASGGTMSVTHWMSPPEFPDSRPEPWPADDARAEDEAFAQVAEKQGPFRPRAPDPSPEARLARLERKLAKLTGRVDFMETWLDGARKRVTEAADRMAAADATLTKKVEEATARIAVLEAGQFRPPMWANPIVTCGPDGR